MPQKALTLLLLSPPVYLVLEGAAMMPLMTAPVFLLLLSLAECSEVRLVPRSLEPTA